MNWQAKWIKPVKQMGDIVPVFAKDFQIHKEIKTACLFVTAMGIYEANINGQRVSQYVLAPGWTSYAHRLQYQKYDVTKFLQTENQLTIYVGKGWYWGNWSNKFMEQWSGKPPGLLAQLELEYMDGKKQFIVTDSSWAVAESEIRFSEIYGGEIYDACVVPEYTGATEVFDGPSDTLIPQEGEAIVEREIFEAVQLIRTPNGESVIDFGQEITGYTVFLKLY